MAAHIYEIIAMLEQEREKWRSSHTLTKTWQEISRYSSVFYLLAELMEEKDIGAFICAYKQHSLSLKGLRACFRLRPGTEDDSYQRRATVGQLFGRMCDEAIALLSTSAVREHKQDSAFLAHESREVSPPFPS